MTDSPRPAASGALVLTTLWRIVFAGVACWGAWFALGLDNPRVSGIDWDNLYAFTNVQGVLVAATAVGSLLSPLWLKDRWDGRWGVFRGASATASLLTLLVFAFLLGGNYHRTSSLLLHLVMPLLALADWIFAGRNQLRLPWWVPLTWTVVPLAYLPFYLQDAADGGPRYGFLDPEAGDFLIWVVILLAAVVVIGYLLLGLGRVRAAMDAGRPVRSGSYPG